ncbi:amino acid permease [Gordonibacter sp. An230]|uniref:APC family permease n=1 Tax=Gordonibacter sp. An230 TaxID=1965592 RepID=UPI000B393E24|nr:APC family permease [Gordonibacter sp. An230]OUO91115.1 amino acid permease [Gordonibacter sp. An230]
MAKTKKLRLFDILCLSFASFFSIELVGSQASIGSSMIFCILVFGVLYLICHGLICAELGSTYPDQGGIYVWTQKAFGSRWAARTTWWYWLNVVSFVPCTLVTLIIVLQQVLGIEIPTLAITVIVIAGTWLAVGLNCISLRHTKVVSNAGSVLKLVVCALLIVGAFVFATVNGSANEFTPETIFPTFDMGLLALVPVYIYGLTGMDLISCNAGEMENPKRDVPRALLIAEIVSIVVYLLSALAVLLVLPQSEIDPAAGMIDAIIVAYGGSKMIVGLIAVALVLVYISYIFGWMVGGNATALEAGEAGELPGWFAKSTKAHAPVGPAVLLGIASTALMLVYGLTASSGSELFWTLLAFTSIIFFLPYIVMSFSLMKLRKADPNAERPFAIPGKRLPLAVAALNFIFLTVAVIGFLVPPEGEDPLGYVAFMLGGIIVSQIIGEALIAHAAKKSATSTDAEAPADTDSQKGRVA